MFKKSRLKIAVVTRANERGFSTVVALGIGLSLTLIGLMMVTRSQGDVATTSSQRAMVKSFNAAETGIVRFQTLIDRNRSIAVYPACGNSSLSDATPCSDTTNRSWFNSAAIPTSAPISISSDVSAAATRNWQNIDLANPSKGQYRLIDYTYDSVLKSATLTVEGRVEQNVGRGPSTTRLVVTVPIIPSALPAVLPGLWAQNFTVGNNPNSKIAATVLDASGIIGGTSFSPAADSRLTNLPTTPIPMTQPYPLSTTAATATKNNFPFPPLPGNTYARNLAGIPAANINTKPCINSSTALSYPQDGDVFTDASGVTNLGTYNSTDSASAPSRSGNYIYRFDPTCIPSISLSNNASLTLGNSVNQTVTLFTDGGINITNTATLESFSDGSGNAAGVTIYSNDDISLGNHTAFAPAEKLQVYVYGNRKVSLDNNVDMRGFLFAPDSIVTLANSGSFVGTVWAKKFSISNTATIYQNSLDVSKLTLTNYIQSSNQLGSISSWGRQQIN